MITESNTLSLLWNIISGTPWWIFVLFVYLFKVSIASRKERIQDIYPMAIMPLMIIILSLHTIYSYELISPIFIIYAVLGKILGISMGWGINRKANITVDREHHLLQMPGSWLNLYLVIILFILKYSSGYIKSACPWILTNYSYDSTIVVTAGFFTGVFLGRFLNCLYRFKIGPFKNMKV